MASKRRLRRKSCERKRRYETYEEAFEAVKKTARAARKFSQGLAALTNGDTLWAYFCSNCHGWHIGHDPQRTTSPIVQAIKKRRDEVE